MTYEFQFGQITPYLPALIRGFGTTVTISAISAAIGMAIVAAIYLLFAAVNGTPARRYARAVAKVYIDINQALPVLVGLVWLYFGLPIYGVTLSADVATEVVLGISLSGFTLDLVMSAEQAIPEGQIFAARVHGLPRSVVLRKIYLPMMARTIADPFAGQLITLLKLSTFASIIGSREVLSVAGGVIAHTYRPMETYTLVALIFVVTIAPLNLLRRLKNPPTATNRDVAG